MQFSFRAHIGLYSRKVLSTVLTVALVSSAMPAYASQTAEKAQPAAAKKPEASAASTAPAAPDAAANAQKQSETAGGVATAAAPPATAQVGGNIAMLRFTGDKSASAELRGDLSAAFGMYGYQVKGVRRGIADAAKKNKCDPAEDECLQRVGQYLNKNAKVPFDFYVFGDVAAPDKGQTKVVIYDIKNSKKVREVVITPTANDLILARTVPLALGIGLNHYQAPPAPLSAEERAALDNPGDPEKTPEEIAEEKRILAEAEKMVKAATAGERMAAVTVDLKKDFKDFCRTGPREDKEVQDLDGSIKKERDLRPVCKRGPVYGYWQPRAWVALALTGASVLATAATYSAALAFRGSWKKAKDELDQAKIAKNSITKEQTGGKMSCQGAPDQSKCYQHFAGNVSDAGDKVRRTAVVGDVLLGASVLMAGVFAIIVFQDRSAAKKYIQQEKALRVSNFRMGPMIGQGQYGAAAGFRF